MPFIIDGHNLIPHIGGLSLGDIDDETQLVQRLRRFTRQVRTHIEVYFDRAPPGRSRSQRVGRVAVFYVSQSRTADQAIHDRLASLGGEVKNWTVVSSDRGVLHEAKKRQANVLSSQDFREWMVRLEEHPDRIADEKWNPSLSNGEVEYWMQQFNQDES